MIRASPFSGPDKTFPLPNEITTAITTPESKALRSLVPSILDEVVTMANPPSHPVGSVARGEAGPDSDLDQLVVLDSLDRPERAQLMGSIRFAMTAPASIDIFVTDVEEYDCRRNVNGSMQYWPCSEGEVVYERTIV